MSAVSRLRGAFAMSDAASDAPPPEEPEKKPPVEEIFSRLLQGLAVVTGAIRKTLSVSSWALKKAAYPIKQECIRRHDQYDRLYRNPDTQTTNAAATFERRN